MAHCTAWGGQERRRGAARAGLRARGLEPATLRPESPTPEEEECHSHSPGGASSSKYANHTLRGDCDEGLRHQHVCCCREDTAVWGPGLSSWSTARTLWTPTSTSSLRTPRDGTGGERGPHPRSGVGAAAPGGPLLSGPSAPVPGRGGTGPGGLHPTATVLRDSADGRLPLLGDEPSVLEAHDQEEDGHCCPGQEGFQDGGCTEPSGDTGASPHPQGTRTRRAGRTSTPSWPRPRGA
ncbi:LOW QUALITY PROTEIN: Amyloid-beta A4 precursor protein-binding family A member 2 [Plecturocebus cupreus]